MSTDFDKRAIEVAFSAKIETEPAGVKDAIATAANWQAQCRFCKASFTGTHACVIDPYKCGLCKSDGACQRK